VLPDYYYYFVELPSNLSLEPCEPKIKQHIVMFSLFIIKEFVSITVILGVRRIIALQADLRCAPKFSACAPKIFSQGQQHSLYKKVSLKP